MAETKEPVTPARIRKLSNEAAEHGDLDMVAICERALEGDAEAIAECARVIAYAKGEAFDARYEVANAIGESIRDGRIAVVVAATERELHELQTEATRAAQDEGGGHSVSGGGYWHGAPGNGWRVRVEAAGS